MHPRAGSALLVLVTGSTGREVALQLGGELIGAGQIALVDALLAVHLGARHVRVVAALEVVHHLHELVVALHLLLDALTGADGGPAADLVIGSRWVPGGTVVNWPRRREALSRGGNLYVRVLLGISVKDATAGFRLFRREALEKLDLASVRSTGYVFQTDMVVRALRAGLTVREVPIEFVERVRGDSKMSGRVAAESLRRITAWGLRERRDQVRRAWERRR